VNSFSLELDYDDVPTSSSADSEMELEHFAEGGVFHDFICHAKELHNIYTDMVRKHGYIFNHEQQTLEA